MKKITIITGHYGSGKTNLAVNLALQLADAGEKVTIVDFDIVNPYFRTADFAKLFEERGVTHPCMPTPAWTFRRFHLTWSAWRMSRGI